MTSFIVGLTGGIGSGKSTVIRFFEALDVGWVDMDTVAREVVTPGSPANKAIAEHFRQNLPDIITSDGELNRASLRHYIFSHPNEKVWLENLLHPIIREQSQRQLAQKTSPYALLVSPLLFEGNINVEASVVIDVDEATQIRRAAQRDNNTPEQIKRIMSQQLPRKKRLEKADFVIDNSADLEHTQKQVLALHTQLLTLSTRMS